MKPSSRILVALLLSIGWVVLLLPLRESAARSFEQSVSDDDRYYLPPPGWLRFFSLGYTELAADMVWVNSVLYFGKEMAATDRTDPGRHVMNYMLTAVALDPQFRSLYTVGSTFTLFQSGGHVTRRSLDMAIELLEKGTEAFPNDGEIFFSLGFMHHYEMMNFVPADPENPTTKRHLELGRYYFGKAALMAGAPPYAALLSANLMEKWGMSDMVVAHLKAMLLKETDPTIRAELIAKLRKEAGKAAERDILQTERLQGEWRRQYPFIPFDFYLVLRTDTPIEELIDPLYRSDQLLDF